MANWIVELEPGVFLAPGDGDPARTLVAEHARVFESHPRAARAIVDARKHRPFEGARIALAPLSPTDSDEDDGDSGYCVDW